MAAELKPDRAIVPIVRYAPEKPISELLGTGFFVGDEETLHLVTAKHVFSGSTRPQFRSDCTYKPSPTGVIIIKKSLAFNQAELMGPVHEVTATYCFY